MKKKASMLGIREKRFADRKMIKLYLIRHGETTANAKGILQGWLNAPLDAKGKQQAERAAAFLADIPLDAVYCSTLQRAIDTAGILTASHHLPIHQNADLREIHFGAWEGLNHTQIVARDPEEWSKFFTQPQALQVPEGETYPLVQKRMAAAWESIKKAEGADRQILIVSHGGAIRTLICYFLKIPLQYMWRLKVDNLGLTCFEFWDSGPIMLFANKRFFE